MRLVNRFSAAGVALSALRLAAHMEPIPAQPYGRHNAERYAKSKPKKKRKFKGSRAAKKASRR